ncbi:hypothetical protein B566_EDAN003741 [Ephemera danica]|nr:hypothetical protein B566_EDAN003741 [Ephemera danica]
MFLEDSINLLRHTHPPPISRRPLTAIPGGNKLPVISVQGVLSKKGLLPCDISTPDRSDSVYMVLWFKESEGEPLYGVHKCS